MNTDFTEACRRADRSAATSGRRFGVAKFHRYDGQFTYTVWPLHDSVTEPGQIGPVTKRGQLGFWSYITPSEEVTR